MPLTMDYVEQHEHWCTAKGIEVKPRGSVGPVEEVRHDWPEELIIWHESQIALRVAHPDLLGIKNDEDPYVNGPNYGPEHNLLTDPDWLKVAAGYPNVPIAPVPFAQGVNFYHAIETEGEKRGWFYVTDGIDHVLPLATSISQYLYAIRQFTDHGFIDVGGGTPWMFTDPTLRWPPDDTPLWFFEWNIGHTVSDLRTGMVPPDTPVGRVTPGSYRDLLPDFIPVT